MTRAFLLTLALVLTLTACVERRPRTLHLEPVATQLPTSGQWRQAFDVVDLDGDGHLDLVHAPARKGAPNPVVFRGPTMSPTALPALPRTYGAVLALDLDGDHHLDLAYALHHRGLVATRADGTPLPLPARARTFSSRTLAAADDLDPAPGPDLVALSDGPRPDRPNELGLLLVTRTAATLVPGSEKNFGDGLALGDVDHDGATDVVMTSSVVGHRGLLCRGRPLTCGPLAGLRPNALVRAALVTDTDVIVALSIFEHGHWRIAIDALRDGAATTLFEDRSRNEILALAVADGVGLIAGRGDGSLLIGATAYPTPEWRRGCPVADLHVVDLDGDHPAEIIASFGADPDVDRCPSGGGIEVLRFVADPR